MSSAAHEYLSDSSMVFTSSDKARAMRVWSLCVTQFSHTYVFLRHGLPYAIIRWLKIDKHEGLYTNSILWE